jgi:hypothetical protein
MFGIFKKKEKEAPTTPLNVGAMAATLEGAFEGMGAGRSEPAVAEVLTPSEKAAQAWGMAEGSEAAPIAEEAPVTTEEAAPVVDFQAMIEEAVKARVVPLLEKIVALEDALAAKQTLIGLLKEQNENLQAQSHPAPQPDVTAPEQHTFQEETQAS